MTQRKIVAMVNMSKERLQPTALVAFDDGTLWTLDYKGAWREMSQPPTAPVKIPTGTHDLMNLHASQETTWGTGRDHDT